MHIKLGFLSVDNVAFVFDDATTAQQGLVADGPVNVDQPGCNGLERFTGEDVLRVVVGEELDAVFPGKRHQLGRDHAAAFQVDLYHFGFDFGKVVQCDKLLDLNVADSQRIGRVVVDQTFHRFPQLLALFEAHTVRP